VENQSASDYRARYYDPGAGRFVTEDTIRSAPENANPYAYVGNAPVTFKDPTGFEQY
jgi:RHS repeat-associated protein